MWNWLWRWLEVPSRRPEVIVTQVDAASPEYHAPLIDVEVTARALQLPCVRLCPSAATSPLPLTAGRFGGRPWLGMNSPPWPTCAACGQPLAFVVQLGMREVPELGLPEGTDLLQLYLCESLECDLATTSECAVTMRFASVGQAMVDSHCEQGPEGVSSIRPTAAFDLPNLKDLPVETAQAFDLQLDADAWTICEETFRALPDSKVGGYPAWIQADETPLCPACSAPMAMLLQLSSDESDDQDGDTDSPPWTSHGWMFGDMGRVYLFHCRVCAPLEVRVIFQGH